MKTYNFLTLALIATTLTLDVIKPKWTRDLYDEVTLESFRTNALFNAAINLKKPDFARLNAAVFYITNEAREAHNLPLLRFHSLLENMALSHSDEMLKREFFSHTHPKDKVKRKIIDRAIREDIPNPYIAENIYFNGGIQFESYLQLADAIVKALMDSPPHKANILNDAALELGCGSSYTAGSWRQQKEAGELIKGFWLITQNFQFYQIIATSHN